MLSKSEISRHSPCLFESIDFFIIQQTTGESTSLKTIGLIGRIIWQSIATYYLVFVASRMILFKKPFSLIVCARGFKMGGWRHPPPHTASCPPLTERHPHVDCPAQANGYHTGRARRNRGQPGTDLKLARRRRQLLFICGRRCGCLWPTCWGHTRVSLPTPDWSAA